MRYTRIERRHAGPGRIGVAEHERQVRHPAEHQCHLLHVSLTIALQHIGVFAHPGDDQPRQVLSRINGVSPKRLMSLATCRGKTL